jgi:hypothetical protein
VTDLIHYEATLQHQVGDGLTSEIASPRGPLKLSVLPADDSIVVGKTGVRVNLEAVPVTVTAADGSVVIDGSTIRVGVINDTQHGARGGGGLHAPANGFAAGFMTPAHYSLVQSLGGILPVPQNRQIIAMDGIAGGGTLAGDVELALIAADSSIVVNEDSIAVGVINDLQHGTRGGGELHAVASETDAGFMIPAHYVLVQSLGGTNPVPVTRQIVAGEGLGGGGSLDGDLEFAIIADDASITVLEDAIRVGTINASQHGDQPGGDLHAQATDVGAGFMGPVHYEFVEAIRTGAFPVPGATFTQTYTTADAALGAYTPDAESTPYVGINGSIGSNCAAVTDANALRVAVENQRLFTEDLAQFVNALTNALRLAGIIQ